MSREIAYPFPTPPRGGVPAEPNASPNEFKPEPDRLMTVKECAEFCNVYQGRINAALQMKQLRHVSLGPRTVRIWFSDLKKWLDQKAVRPVSQRSLAQERALQREDQLSRLRIIDPAELGISMSRRRSPKD
jgi:excisionase family DNA binding protein